MKRLLLITLSLLSRGPVYAEWVAIEKEYQSPGLQTVYIDPDTIRREGNLVTIWQLTDYVWMQGNAGFGRFGFGPQPIFVDEDPQAIRLRGQAPSVAGVHGVLKTYGNRQTE